MTSLYCAFSSPESTHDVPFLSLIFTYLIWMSPFPPKAFRSACIPLGSHFFFFSVKMFKMLQRIHGNIHILKIQITSQHQKKSQLSPQITLLRIMHLSFPASFLALNNMHRVCLLLSGHLILFCPSAQPIIPKYLLLSSPFFPCWFKMLSLRY